jgi:hypothetical protein
MNWSLKVILSVVLVAAGTVGAFLCGVVLARQGLDRAEKIVSIGGVIASVLIAAAGLWLGWLTWRNTASTTAAPPSANAAGVGAVAVGGSSGGPIVTHVSGTPPPPAPPPSASPPGAGVSAAGIGSVAVGGDTTAAIRTTVTGPGGTTP